MIKFREHRGTLDDSMKTVIELRDRPQLIRHLRNLLPTSIEVTEATVTIKFYSGFDSRIEWRETYMVQIRNFGVAGFIDGPI